MRVGPKYSTDLREASVSGRVNALRRQVFYDELRHARFHPLRPPSGLCDGLVNQELLLQNEYLAAENRILRAHLATRFRLSDPERSTLAEIGKRLGRKALREVARTAKPETSLGWYQRLIAHKFDGSRHRAYPGRPRVGPAVEALVVRLARENRSWGYDRSMAHSPTWAISCRTKPLAISCADATSSPQRPRVVGAPIGRSSSGRTWTCSPGAISSRRRCGSGLVTYVLFIIELESRRVWIGGITRHPEPVGCSRSPATRR